MTAINATVSELSGVRLALSLPVADLNLYAAGVHPRDCGDTRGFPSDEHSLLNYNVSVSSSESQQQQQLADANNWLDLSVEVRKVANDADWESEADCHAHFLGGHAPLNLLKEEGHDQLDVLLGNPNLHNSSGCDLLEKEGHVLHNEGSSCSSTAVLSSSKKKRPKTAAAAAAAAGVDAASPSRQAQQPPQPCSMCTKVFTSTSALTKHRLTHSDERRFACHLCGKAFKRQDHLNGHLITHREKKPFECTINGCGKSYCDARSLRRHQDNHHAPSSNGSSTQSPAPEAAAKAAIFTDLSCSINYPSSNGSSFVEPSPEYSAALDPWNGTAGAQQEAAAAYTDIVTDAAAAVNWGSFAAESPSEQHQQQQQQQQARKPKVKSEKAKAKKAKTKAKKSDPNEGLTTQQLELIQQIMRQTQEQHRLQQEEQKQQQQQQQQQPKSKKHNIKQKTVGSGQNSDNNCLPDCGRPVECNVCQRRFKNTPALNGHMRLHGGFLKKDAECKKPDKKDPNTPPLQTASVSVRALIEEKIIQRRNMAATGTAGTPTGMRISTGSCGVEPQADKAGNDEEMISKEESLDIKMEEVQQAAEDSYFEGSFLALSPASLHRALEGEEAEVGGAISSSTEASSSVAEAQQDHFFSTSSSSSSALSDVSLLDDAVFHQVSAAAASALLSDISSLDLQSYIDGAQPAGQSNVYTDCLSQYLQSSTYEQSSFVQQPQYNFNDSAAAQYQQQPGFNFDPSPIPSTPLSSLCSPQYIAEQFQAAAAQFDCSSQQHSMLLPTPSPYTPSPSPVSPAVSMTTAPLPHAFQQHGSSYYPSSFTNDLQAQNNLFLMDCSSQVPYSMDVAGLATPQWDHSSFPGCTEQQLQHVETIPVFLEETPAAAKVKPSKKRSADPKAAVKLTLVKSPKLQPEAAERRKAAKKSKPDEFDAILGLSKGSSFASSLKEGSHFVPAPMLNPNRPGTGLFKNLVTEEKSRSSSAKPRINLGKDFQCTALPRCKKEGSLCKESEAAEILWDPQLDSPELDQLLAWSQSAATPVKKKSTEQVMQVFALCRGDVRAAKLAMMKDASTEQPSWNTETVQLFGEALKQYGKDFGRIAQSIPMTGKVECAQFYYLWKLLYRDEYQQLKGNWRRAGKTSSQAKEVFMEGLESTALSGGGGAAAASTSAACAALAPSEFGDCPTAISTSRSRKSSSRCHSNQTITTTVTTNPAASSSHSEASPAVASSAAASSRSPSSSSTEQAVDKLYPCSICHKVYEKVKSRSAHMKTHKTNSSSSSSSSSTLCRTNQQQQQQSKKKNKYQSPSSPSHSSMSSSSSLPSPFFSSGTHATF